MKHLVVGYMGKVGGALYELINEANEDVDGTDMKEEFKVNPPYDFIHICIPEDKNFVNEVRYYLSVMDSLK